MKCSIVIEGRDKPMVVDLRPSCGEDFCDQCGDCLHCYGSDPCVQRGEDRAHMWVHYVGNEQEAREFIEARKAG